MACLPFARRFSPEVPIGRWNGVSRESILPSQLDAAMRAHQRELFDQQRWIGPLGSSAAAITVAGILWDHVNRNRLGVWCLGMLLAGHGCGGGGCGTEFASLDHDTGPSSGHRGSPPGYRNRYGDVGVRRSSGAGGRPWGSDGGGGLPGGEDAGARARHVERRAALCVDVCPCMDIDDRGYGVGRTAGGGRRTGDRCGPPRSRPVRGPQAVAGVGGAASGLISGGGATAPRGRPRSAHRAVESAGRRSPRR